jgi:hypothetical protein
MAGLNVDAIEARIAELEEAKAQYVERASAEFNRQAGAFDGAIAELRRLLGDDSAPGENEKSTDNGE